MPAKARPIELAVFFAVWYQAKADATRFLPPMSAITALRAGSRQAWVAP